MGIAALGGFDALWLTTNQKPESMLGHCCGILQQFSAATGHAPNCAVPRAAVLSLKGLKLHVGRSAEAALASNQCGFCGYFRSAQFFH